ncbi:hypothetical protein AWR27_21490 [Spirosoma montaniterrae]|uniref:RNA polymerase sigma-70 region 2 domain-containing protein n=1 Tax=Spirosoma montaniterrae TaxID=1178516 RepID=A0A1P9X1Y7_9BACT|nr:hypothetical protein AWR27_21490 [Spirosoma montaniterrae]
MPEKNLVAHLTAGNKDAFAQLYDVYAPALLSVICRIVGDSAKSATVLETAFRQIHQRIPTYKPNSQPLFVWLMDIARRTALDAVADVQKPAFQPLQLSATGRIRVSQAVAAPPVATTEPHLSEFLQAVLHKNCTPEEAARLLGLPADSARQQLRLAMLQFRAQQV